MTNAQPGAFCISLDFELHWGVRDKRTVEDYRANLLGVREVVPRLLDLFGEYGIHATWAAVGFLFFGSRDELLAAVPAEVPSYELPELSPYPQLASIGPNEAEDPYHFAPNLIDQIRSAPGQELASHTFCHYYCLEAGQTLDQFRADLKAVRQAFDSRGLPLCSIIFPRNQVSAEHLAACAEAGLVAYRDEPDHALYRPRAKHDETRSRRALRLIDAYLPLSGDNCSPLPVRKRAGQPANVAASRFLRPYSKRLASLDGLRLNRIAKGLNAAAASGRLYHLWWHPHNFGGKPEQNLAFLRRVLELYRGLHERKGLRSLNMGELAAEAVET